MAVNPYFIPAEYEYQPYPIDFLLRAGEYKQRRADQVHDDLAKMQGQIAGLSSIQEHDPYRNKFVQDFNNQALELINSNQDYSSPDFRRKSRELIYGAANNQYLQTLNRSIENKKAYLDEVEKLKASNEYREYNDPYAGGFQGIDEQGNPIEFQRQSPIAYSSHEEPVYAMFDKIKASGFLKDSTAYDPETNMYGSIKAGSEGVALKTLHNAIHNPKTGTGLINTFLGTEGGQDFQRKFLYEHPGATGEDLANAAAKHMDNIARLYVYNKSTSGSDISLGPEWANQYTDSGQRPTHTSSPVEEEGLSAATDFKFDANGMLDTSASSAKEPQFIFDDTGAMIKNPAYYAGATQEQSARGHEQRGQLANIRAMYPNLATMNDKSLFEVYQKALKNYNQKSKLDINPSPNANSVITNNLKTDMFTRPATLVGGNQKVNVFEGDGGIMDQLHYDSSSPEDRKAFLEHVQNVKIQPQGLVPGSYAISVPDKKTGISRRIYVAPDVEVQQAFGRTFTLGKVVKGVLEGKTTEATVPYGNNIYQVKTSIPNPKHPSVEVEIHVLDAQGNPIMIPTADGKQEPFVTTLDEIYQNDEKGYTRSGFNRSNVGKDKPVNP